MPRASRASATGQSSSSPSPPARTARGCCPSSSKASTHPGSPRPMTSTSSPLATTSHMRARRSAVRSVPSSSPGSTRSPSPVARSVSTRSTSRTSRSPRTTPPSSWSQRATARCPRESRRSSWTASRCYADPAILAGAKTLSAVLSRLLALVPERGYLAIMAYLDRGADSSAADLRAALAARLSSPVTFGWGPRFLHSTGQYHKGGPQHGVFLQLTGDVVDDLDIPGRPFSFSRLQMAQALGDVSALASRSRPVIRLHLTDRANGLRALHAAVAGIGSGEDSTPVSYLSEPAAGPARPQASPDRRPLQSGHLRGHRRPRPQEAHAGDLRPRQPGSASSGVRPRRVRPTRLGRPGLRQCRARRGQGVRPHAVPRRGVDAARRGLPVRARRVRRRRRVRHPRSDGRGPRPRARHRRQPRLLPVHPAEALPCRHRPAQAVRPVRRQRRRVAARGRREAVRPRPGKCPRAQPDHRRGLPVRVGVPHRPLPGQGDRPEHPRPAVREQPCSSRSGTAGTSTTCRSPWPKTSGSAGGPATTTASGRPAM